MPKAAKTNFAMEEAELKKLEEFNKRKSKALDEQAELLRKEQEIERARGGSEDLDGEKRVSGLITEQFADIIQGLEEDGKFWVFRIDERGRSSQCGAWPVADWPSRMEEIAHDAGGGTFKIQFKTAAGLFVKQTTMTFDPKFYGKKAEAAAGPGDGIMHVLAEMNRSTSQVLEAGRRDMMEMMKTIVTVMAGQKSSGPNYQEIAALGQIFKGDSPAAGGSELLLKGIEMGMKMGEGKEPPSTMDRVIENLAGPAMALLSRVQPRTPAPTAPALPANLPRPIAEPAAPPAPPLPAAPVEAAPDEKALVRENPFYKTYVPKILEAARTGQDVKEWAEYICDMIPALYHPQLLEILQKPDLVEYLGSFEPEARDRAVWITSCRDAVLGLFPPEEVPEPKGGLHMVPAPVDEAGRIVGVVPEAAIQALSGE